jgi:hypothetical protein
MYKPQAKDIRFTPWDRDSVYDSKEVSIAVLYLSDSPVGALTEGGHFGYRQSAIVPTGADSETRKRALEDAVATLLGAFDIEKSAKENNYMGDLEKLQVCPLPNVLTLTEILES